MVQEELSVERPSGGDTPLRKFIGVLKEVKRDQRESRQDGSKYMVAQFNFADVEVLESVEIYPYPIAVIGISYAPPKTSGGDSKWEAFAASLRKLMPQNPDINNLVGKKQEWLMVERQLRRALNNEDGSPMVDGNGRAIWGPKPVLCWTVVSVEGVGSAKQKDEDFNEVLVGLADGKTEPEFYTAALGSEEVRNRPNIVQALTGRTLLSTLTEMGLLSRDAEGILHKTSGETPQTTSDANGAAKEPPA